MIFSKHRSKKELIASLTRIEQNRKSQQAEEIISELNLLGASKKSVQQSSAELISKKFGLEAFAVFFRYNDKFVPRIYHGINYKDLNEIKLSRIKDILGNAQPDGIIKNDEIFKALHNSNLLDEFKEPLVFIKSWAKSKAALMIFDDPQGMMQFALQNSSFNENFWPGLEHLLDIHLGFREAEFNLKKTRLELGKASKELTNLNKILNKKILDMHSYVKISNDLYTQFSEAQLYPSLIETIQRQFDTSLSLILTPGENGLFVPPVSSKLRNINAQDFSLSKESEIFQLLSKSSKPILLPMIAPGLSKNEPFVESALNAGLQIACPLKASGELVSILLIGTKKDKSQYSSQDLDSLYVITNLASLSIENIRQYSTIERLSFTDSMTGIYNYRYFYKRLNEEILRAQRYNREISLVILDIDNFKSFNDNFGHQAGDQVLKGLADLITKTIRTIDVVSRYGGEEFCIIMPDTGVSNCQQFIDRLKSEIENFKFQPEASSSSCNITVSIGAAVFSQHANNIDRLIYCADMALLKAKGAGRNRALMFQPMDSGPIINNVNDELTSGRLNVNNEEVF